ncbi:pro-sigmaK processing inhibitor BofA family protein [Senegalia massiliensis]|uniref:pro-sigmaK processing inhibitor BofA family protein n=1 Tax=Senegalia massiliensis TaxID=1720316 RepID=UPI00102FCD95|nr:pro-sigmaK processing inhibitor BofA family protein [Senegalia massiliensis]
MFSEWGISIPIIIIALFFLGFIIMLNSRRIMKLVLNSIVGIISLLLYNMLLSGITGVYIGINLVTVFVVTILGIPGFILLIILNLIL